MVVAISCLPEPRLATSQTFSSGWGSGVCSVRREGTAPSSPRRASKYRMTSESGSGT